jgi:CTP synthase (UTP-ammonia lyase)
VRILALGDRDGAHLTHRELDAAFALMPEDVECAWTPTDSRQAREIDAADAVWLLPGTPYRDDDAAYEAIAHCHRSGTPFLGTCGGFQYACVELARSLARVDGAGHAESEPGAEELVVVALACSLYGEVRTIHPVAGTRLAEVCGDGPFDGFHWCGFGLEPRFAEALQDAGVVVGAHAADAGVEAIELPDHPFFMATAFQPQVGNAEAGALHPLIGALIEAGRRRTGAAAGRPVELSPGPTGRGGARTSR